MVRQYVINGRFLTQKMTGVHRYAYQICCALHQLNFDFIVVAPQNINLDYNCIFDVVRIGKTTSHLWEQVELPFYVNRHYRNSVLINLTGIGSFFHKNIVSTIHDLSFLENPKWFSKPYYLLYKYLTPLVARKAKKIITVSHFSKNEIINKYRIDENKIVVIYNAVSKEMILDDELSKAKIILSVSSLNPRKNFQRLLEAFDKLNNSEYKLVIVGKKDNIFGSLELSNKNNNIQFTGYISDKELISLYRKASVFVYPSLYEGFGIPNLEAMNNGCPVITSNIPPHREVCQGAALYFDPMNTDELVEKLKQLINNKSQIDEMINRGYDRARCFSWEKSASLLIKTLEKL